ncbi:MAG: hypothetical protein WAL85_12800 [Candidatus Korobacteraceae bacterium]
MGPQEIPVVVGVTPGLQADYNGVRSFALTLHANTTSADSKLAPCMVRPNLFSGD